VCAVRQRVETLAWCRSGQNGYGDEDVPRPATVCAMWYVGGLALGLVLVVVLVMAGAKVMRKP